MGFAGQVFAARIAVGLAVPSASALSRTGGMLAKGAAGIYTALNSQRKAQASKRVGDAQAEVTRLTKLTKDNADRQSRLIEASARHGMKKLEAAGAANTAALAKGGAGAFADMKASMGSEGAMFDKVEKLSRPLARLMKMSNNYSKMSSANQKAAVNQAKQFKQAKIDQVQAIKEENKANQEAMNTLKDTSDKRTKVFKKAEAELNKRIKNW